MGSKSESDKKLHNAVIPVRPPFLIPHQSHHFLHPSRHNEDGRGAGQSQAETDLVEVFRGLSHIGREHHILVPTMENILKHKLPTAKTIIVLDMFENALKTVLEQPCLEKKIVLEGV